MGKLLVDAEWLINQYPQYKGDALKYILEFPEVEELTPQQEMANEVSGLIEKLSVWKDRVSNIWPETWEPVDNLLDCLQVVNEGGKQ